LQTAAFISFGSGKAPSHIVAIMEERELGKLLSK
jgi:hypothetical protein